MSEIEKMRTELDAQLSVEKKIPIKEIKGSEFIGEYEVIDFLVDGIIEEGRLYTLTAPTGTGKTAVALVMAEKIALGAPFGTNATKQSGVMFLAGENPNDVRVRFMAMCERNEALKDAPIYFIKNSFDVKKCIKEIEAILAKHPDIKIVIVDTLQAFFTGDDSNSNTQKIDFAKTLRMICDLGVAVLTNAHPTKNPTKETNEPYGGGGLVNEIDGNLALWKNDDESIELYWCKKFRGAFEPFSLELEKVPVESAVNSRGEPLTSVIAKVIDEKRQTEMRGKAQSDDLMVLQHLKAVGTIHKPNDVAKTLGWKYADGKTDGSRIRRSFTRLTKQLLIGENSYGHYITKKGKELIDRETPF